MINIIKNYMKIISGWTKIFMVMAAAEIIIFAAIVKFDLGLGFGLISPLIALILTAPITLYIRSQMVKYEEGIETEKKENWKRKRQIQRAKYLQAKGIAHKKESF